MMHIPEILLIDDDALASYLRKRVLELKGYRVQMALDGFSGAILAKVLRPALILMDHQLPGMSGPELLERLRAECPDTPILVHSGHLSLFDLYPDTPDAFLTKGGGVENMLRAIAQHLPQQGTEPSRETP